MRRAYVVGCVLALASEASPARAAPSPPAIVAEPVGQVPIVLAGDAVEGAKLEVVLRELLGRLGVAPTVRFAARIDSHDVTEPPAAPPPAVARVWIELRPGDVAVVYLADARWERVLVRRAPLAASVDEVAREQIAQIVAASVEALLAGGVVGVARAEIASPPPRGEPPPAPAAPPREPAAPPPEPPPEPPPAPSPASSRAPAASMPAASLRVQLALGYEALVWSRLYLAHGPVASVLVVGGRTTRIGAGISAQTRVPVVAFADPVGVRVTATSLRIVGHAERDLSPRVTAHVGAGLGLDVLGTEPRTFTPSANLVVEPSRTRLSPILRATFGLDVRLTPAARATVALVIDHELDRRDYVVRKGDAEETVLGTYPVRVGLVLRLGADLFAR